MKKAFKIFKYFITFKSICIESHGNVLLKITLRSYTPVQLLDVDLVESLLLGFKLKRTGSILTTN